MRQDETSMQACCGRECLEKSAMVAGEIHIMRALIKTNASCVSAFGWYHFGDITRGRVSTRRGASVRIEIVTVSHFGFYDPAGEGE
jgi:hypothetical protein